MNIDTIPRYLNPNPAFRNRKAAQACAFFSVKCETGLDKLKLIKLIYLAEREHLSSRSRPILWDELYSLPHGPIGSSTLNGIDGNIHEEIWRSFIARHGNKIFAVRRFDRDDLDELSNAELRTLASVWERYGHMSASQLRNFTHDHCPEYTETDGKRIPIDYAKLLVAVGMTEEDALIVESELLAWRKAEAVLHS